jgi:predicted metalloprotease with PDZ domain
MNRISAIAMGVGLGLATLVCGPDAFAQAAARGAGDSLSAPIHDVHYDVTFTRANATQRVVDVAMTLTTAGNAPVVLSLPAWTPGAYEMGNFARWVTAFDAWGDDKPLVWDKTDYDTWRIRPAGAKSIRVRLRYAADTLDNAMSWARPDFLLVNGTNVFLYAEGQPLDFASTVTVHTESDWHVATGLTPAKDAHSYSATNYHDLVDMPFFVGRFDLDSARIAERWVRLATYPAGSIAGQVRQSAWDQLKRVIPVESAVFGETPWENYTVMQIVDSAYGGASGLEHQSSHVDVLAPSYVGSEFQPSLYAHEIFHSWNVKRLRPAEMWPYQYSHPQPTPLLWVSEGITDYYADLAEVRGGVVDAAGFYALTSEKINEVSNAPPTALEDASLNTWIHPIDGTGYLYYPKGSLAGLMIDILIRDASDNAHSLDEVMRSLYQSAYKRGHGFTSADWWNAVSAAANGKSFAAFSAHYIEGRDPFPWDSLLTLAGMRARQERVPRLGVVSQMDGDAIVVTSIEEGSAAALAGVKVGDSLISVGDIPVEDQQFGAKMRAKYGASIEGSPLPIKVKRGAEAITLSGKLHFAPGEVMVEANPAATPKATRIRDGILKGTTGR